MIGMVGWPVRNVFSERRGQDKQGFCQMCLKNQITYEEVLGSGKLQKQFPTVPEVFWGIIIIDIYGGDV